MRRSVIKTIWAVIDVLLPCIVAACLVGRFGLIWVGAVVILEWLQLMISKHILHMAWNLYDGWKIVLTAAGIVVGTARYAVQSIPDALGIAATILVIILHSAVYFMISNFIRK